MADVLASKLTLEHADDILALERSELAGMRKVYEEARQGLLARLAAAGPDTFTAQHYRVTLAQVEKGLAELQKRLQERGHAAAAGALEQSSSNLLEQIAYWESARGFKFAAHGRIQEDALRRVNREVLLQTFDTSIERYGLELIGDVQRKLGVHMAMRSSWATMANDVAGQLDGAAIAGAQWKAERIVRTELHNALQAGHQAALEAAAPKLPGLARQWDSRLDARTSDVCKSLNGQVRGLKEPWTWQGRLIMRPPAIPNCRSSVVPWRKEWAALDDSVKVADLPAGTKAELEAADAARAARAAARAESQKAFTAQRANAKQLVEKLNAPDLNPLHGATWGKQLLALDQLPAIADDLGWDLALVRKTAEEAIKRAGAIEQNAIVLKKALEDWGAGARSEALVKRIAAADALDDYKHILTRAGLKAADVDPIIAVAKTELLSIDDLASAVKAWDDTSALNVDNALYLISENRLHPDRFAAAVQRLGKPGTKAAHIVDEARTYAQSLLKSATDDFTEAVAAHGLPTAPNHPAAISRKGLQSRWIELREAEVGAFATTIEAAAAFSDAVAQPHLAKGLMQRLQAATGPAARFRAARDLESLEAWGDELSKLGTSPQLVEKIQGSINDAKAVIVDLKQSVSEFHGASLWDKPKHAKALLQADEEALELAAELHGAADPKKYAKALAADAMKVLDDTVQEAVSSWKLSWKLDPNVASESSALELALSDLAIGKKLTPGSKPFIEFVAQGKAKAAIDAVKELTAELTDDAISMNTALVKQDKAKLQKWAKQLDADLGKHSEFIKDAALQEAFGSTWEVAKAEIPSWKAGKFAWDAPPAPAPMKAWPKTQSGAPEKVTLPNGKLAVKASNSTGSNPGGFYITNDGTSYFIKFPKATGQVAAESSSAKLASKMNLTVKDYESFAVGDAHVAIAGPKVKLNQIGEQGLKGHAAANADEMAAQFVHAAWTRNWDAVGLGFDNLVEDAAGKLMVVDYGGSLLWRAQGALKPGGMPEIVEELTSLRNPGVNQQTASVFGNLSDGQIAKAIQQRLALVSDDEISAIIKSAGFDTADADVIEEGLVARKKWLEKWAESKLGKAAPTPSAKAAAAKAQVLGGFDDVHKSLLGHLDVDLEAAGLLKTGTTGNGGASIESLSATWKKALVDRDPAALAKMGRRLWAITPSLKQDQDLALRLLYTAWQKAPDVVKAELAAWDTMKEVLEQLELAPKNLGSIEDIRAGIAAQKAKAEAAAAVAKAEQAKKLAELKAKQSVTTADYEAKLATYKTDLAEWQSKVEKIQGKASNAKGEPTAAYLRKLKGWLTKDIPKRKAGLSSAAQSAIADYETQLTQAANVLADAEQKKKLYGIGTDAYVSTWKKREVNQLLKQAKQLEREAEAALRKRAEQLAEEAGILPKRPEMPLPPAGAGGLSRPSEFWTHHVSADEIDRYARRMQAELGSARSHTYLQGTLDPERAWFTDLLEEPARPYTQAAGLRALRQFTGSSYRPMRAAKVGRNGYKDARGNVHESIRKHQIPEYKRLADDCDEFISRLPGYDCTKAPSGYITRKETFASPADRTQFLGMLENAEAAGVPHEMTWNAPSSSSTNVSTWHGDLIFKIKGRVSGSPINSISSAGGENEVLFPSGVKFRVVKHRVSGSTVEVEIVEVFADGTTGLD